MRPGGDMTADLVEVDLHGARVGEGQHERRSLAAHRTDRAEQVGVGVALVGRQARSRALLRPDPGAAVLLTQPCLIPRVEPEGRL
jgi:hypothetical protein